MQVRPPSPAITRLTEGGCCRDPIWHPDGTRVLFVDAIPGQRLAGTFAAPANGDGAPSVFWKDVAVLSPDGSRIAYPDFAARVTRIQEFGKTSVATLNNNNVPVTVSPDGRQVAWVEQNQNTQPMGIGGGMVRIWTANADGTNARLRANNVRFGGGITWLPDGRRLISTRRDAANQNPGIYTLDLDTGTTTRVVSAFSARALRLAPDGRSFVYLAALEADREANGLWHVRFDTGERRKLPLIGGVRWLPDSSGIVMVPTQSGGGPDALVRVDPVTLAVTPLTERGSLPFRIAQDQWQLSPDATRIAFVSLDDTNIHVLRFAP